MSRLQSAFGDEATVVRDPQFRVLLLATVFPVLGTTLVSPILESVIEPLGTSPGNVGLLISFLTAPAIVVIPLSGVLADRYGRRPVLVAALLLFGAGGSAIAFTGEFRVALALRAVQGVGFAGIVPVITASIGDMYDGEREVTGQGLRMTVNGTSGAVLPLVAGVLVGVAWQYPFVLYALAFPVAAVVALQFGEPTAAAEESSETGVSAYHRVLFGFVSHPGVLSMVVARALPVVVWVGFLTYNSLLVVRAMGGTPFQAGLLVAVGNLLFAGGASQVGRVISLFGGKFRSLVAANLSLAAGFAGFLFTSRVELAVPWIALSGAGFGVTISVYRSYLTEVTPEPLRAGVVSFGAAGGRVAATLTPVAMGLVIDTTTPVLGETLALRVAGLVAVTVGSGGGLLCLAIASASEPVSTDLSGVSQEGAGCD